MINLGECPKWKIWKNVKAAFAASDWRGVLEWQGRMEELMEGQPVDLCELVLRIFRTAHTNSVTFEGVDVHAEEVVGLEIRRIELLGRMERFRDQGMAMCNVADNLNVMGRRAEGLKYFKRARGVAEAHGFFSVECQSCIGLGKNALAEGRGEEGVDFLRNALLAAPLEEEEARCSELGVLQILSHALIKVDARDEAASTILRFQKTATARSRKSGYLCEAELHSHFVSAILHEVLRICNPC
jgi:hypothetical protein